MKMGNDKNLQVICKGSLHAFSVTTFAVEEINLIFGNTFAHIHTPTNTNSECAFYKAQVFATFSMHSMKTGLENSPS